MLKELIGSIPSYKADKSLLTFEQATQYSVRVMHDDQVFGHITKIQRGTKGELGYKFFAIGNKVGGETFPTLESCQLSLVEG